MAFKRALWSSGYTYRISCPYCGTTFAYTDRQLDYRPWFPNGFIYCQRCRKPLRHHEIFAIHDDGSPVYNSVAEAEQAVHLGYAGTHGFQQPSAPPVQPQENVNRCTKCGRPYKAGTDHFCSGCGNKLD